MVSFIKNQGIPTQYTEEVTTMAKKGTVSIAGVEGDIDDLFKEAVKVVCQYDKASSSLFKEDFRLAMPEPPELWINLKQSVLFRPSDGSSKPREVLVQNAEDFLAYTWSTRLPNNNIIHS